MEDVARNNVIIFQEFAMLADEVEKLRKELSVLMLERDELRFVVAKNLEMSYMLEVGALEYKVYEAQCRMLRFKRKVELIQAQKNRQEKVNLANIETLLDQEFLEYTTKLEEKMSAMSMAIERSKGDYLTASETRQLKKMYHQIVKVLHPDLNPELPETRLQLFYQAVHAYETGDLMTMRLIFEMVANESSLKPQQSAIHALVEEKKRLVSLIAKLNEELVQIRTRYPFTIEELLKDASQLEAYKMELEKIYLQYEEASLSYQTRIKKMVVGLDE